MLRRRASALTHTYTHIRTARTHARLATRGSESQSASHPHSRRGAALAAPAHAQLSTQRGALIGLQLRRAYSTGSKSDYVIVTFPGPGVDIGTVREWKKQVGDLVARGELIASMENIKTEIEVNNNTGLDAYLAAQLFPEGTTGIPPNEPVAVLVKDAKLVPKFTAYSVPRKTLPFGIKGEAVELPLLLNMSYVTIVAWKKQVGDVVCKGDELAELKSGYHTHSLKYPHETRGYVAKHFYADGADQLYYRDVLAAVVSDKADIPKLKDFSFPPRFPSPPK